MLAECNWNYSNKSCKQWSILIDKNAQTLISMYSNGSEAVIQNNGYIIIDIDKRQGDKAHNSEMIQKSGTNSLIKVEN